MSNDIAMQNFNQTLAAAQNSDAVFEALHHLTDTLIRAKLFTIMRVDMDAMLVATVNMLNAERHYTPERVTRAEQDLLLPAMAAVLYDMCRG